MTLTPYSLPHIYIYYIYILNCIHTYVHKYANTHTGMLSFRVLQFFHLRAQSTQSRIFCVSVFPCVYISSLLLTIPIRFIPAAVQHSTTVYIINRTIHRTKAGVIQSSNLSFSHFPVSLRSILESSR